MSQTVEEDEEEEEMRCDEVGLGCSRPSNTSGAAIRFHRVYYSQLVLPGG